MLNCIRILLFIIGTLDDEIWQMDVEMAFLNGYLMESIYMKQSEGFKAKDKEQKVYKMLKFIYELKYSSRS